MSDHRHQILNPADHSDLRVATGAGARFGDAVMSCLVVPAEFRRLACEYPLLFRYDGEARSFSALALLGFEPGENLFLEGEGWDATARPLALTVPPFLIGRSRDGSGPAQVHVDVAHSRISQGGEGVAVFDEDGRPTPFLEDMAGLLGLLDEGYRAAPDFYATLDRYDLLEPFSMDATLDDGASHRLVGYHLIAEERLQALEPSVLAELHAAGYLEPIFMAVASLGNLGKLVRRKNRRRHG